MDKPSPQEKSTLSLPSIQQERSTLSIQEVDRAEISNDHLRSTLLKPPEIRSYDDLLLLKSFMMRTEFVIRHLDRIVNPRQMDELCRNIGIEMFNEGGIVFNQGDTGDKVYIMLEGSVDLKIRYRINLMQGESEMREKFIKTYDVRGSCFGERALQNDELRSGTVVATTLTTLITVSKESYAAALRDAKIQNDGISRDKLGTKESVITILSKMREKRSNQELEGVASYLHYRIPFFQKFSMPQLVELCRVSDIITSWSRSILFKQGSIGQAFYVILTGTVEVWTQTSLINSSAISRSPSMYNSTSQLAFQAIHQMSNNNNKLIPRINDITEGLGTKVSELNTGETFGERALENEDSLRMASIVSYDGNTELIVISKEDYHNLVYVMMHAETMSRITLLRKTDLFRSIDVGHLKGLAKYMEQRKYKLNEVIYATGSKASEMIIIESGECQVETEIKEYKDLNNNNNNRTKKGTNKIMTSTSSKVVATGQATPISDTATDVEQQQLQLPQIVPLQSKKLKDSFSSPQQQLIGPAMKLNLGRVGPNSVLSTYITSLTLSDEVIHPETLIASTPVVAYSISKHDYYNYLHKETRFFIDRLVMNYKKPVLGFLWQSSPKIIDENSWKKEQTWKKFKEDLMNDPKRQANIMDAYKAVGNIRLTEDSGNSNNTTIAQRNAAILKAREALDTGKKHVTVDMNWGLPAGWNQSINGSTVVSDENSSEKSNSIAGSRIDSPGSIGGGGGNDRMNSPSIGGGGKLYDSKAVSKLIRKRINNNNIENNILKKEFISAHSLELPSTLTRPLFDDVNNNYNPESKRAFTLVQIHRESIKSNAHGGLLDGRKKMVRCYLRICGVYESTEIAKAVADSQMENIYLTLYRSDPTREVELLLHWNMFKGFDNISLSNTDHFMIYCKSAPVLYASLTPSRNIFNSLYPALCKQPNQRYACVVINKLKDNICPATNDNNNNNNIIKRDGSFDVVSDSSDSDESIKDSQMMIMTQQGNNDKRPKKQLLKSNKSASFIIINNKNKNNNNNNNTSQSKTANVVSTAGGQQQQQQQMKYKDGMSNSNSGFNKSTVVAANSNDVNNYLLEFSALSEVLFVTPNRLPCLRYAITRFGTMTDPTLYVPDDRKIDDSNDGNGNGNEASNSGDGGKEGTKVYQQEAPTKAISSVLQSHMYIKKPYENPSDRVLLELATGDKRICIIPLFNWILINDETITTLDFINCFNEQSQQMIFLQEELEHNRVVASTTSLMGSALSTIGTKTNITKDKLESSSNNHNNNLYKVFNEVDLLETDKLLDNLTKSNQKYTLEKASTDAMDRAILTNKSLKMLETELSSRELNINVKATVVKMKHRAMEEAENARNMINKYDLTNNDNDNNDDISIVEKTQLQIDARLSSLNTTVSAQLKVVDNHNELCEVEHKAFENDFSPTKPNTSKKQTEKLIESRMGIIDHLQKLRFEKITLETVINNYNAQRYKSLILDEAHNAANGGVGGGGTVSGSVEEEGSPKSTAVKNKNRFKTFNNLLSSSSNGNHVNAGKRLAESIQALAETLNAKAK